MWYNRRMIKQFKPNFDIIETITEITKWDEVEYNVPAHTYHLNKYGHLISYIKEGTSKVIKFKSPIKAFSKARRKFIKE